MHSLASAAPYNAYTKAMLPPTNSLSSITRNAHYIAVTTKMNMGVPLLIRLYCFSKVVAIVTVQMACLLNILLPHTHHFSLN